MVKLSSLSEVSTYLRRFHDSSTVYSLDNMISLMESLGNPQNSFKAIHVAGTSGKTSTAYFMSALLSAAGKKTGLTVSPHVDKLNERLQINGQPLSEVDFCRALSKFLTILESLSVMPSWFEVIISFAYWFFAQQKLDYAVVEVGLGGLKDATNVINRSDKTCIITDIGYDHMNVLGNSLAEIAEQKAGIIQPGNVVFCFEQPDEVMAVLRRNAKARGAQLQIVSEAPSSNQSIPAYQLRNWSLAYSVYQYLVKRDELKELTGKQLADTQQTFIPGRMDVRLRYGKTIIMDGAHNQQKMAAFVDSFQKLYPGVKAAVLIAMRNGKEYHALAPTLASIASRVITTTFTSSQDLPIRSMSAAKLASSFKDIVPTESVDKASAALAKLLEGTERYCVITGSIYLLGELRHTKLIK